MAASSGRLGFVGLELAVDQSKPSRDSSTRPASWSGSAASTEGDTYRELAPARVVRERNPGTTLLVYGNLPPARIELRRWYEDGGALRELQKASAAGS
jgi:hypothetical protein